MTTTSGSFEAGVDGALPGIIMPADPQPGMRYRQEFYEGEAEDNGEILSTSETTELPYGRLREHGADEGHERPRARRVGVQAVRRRRRPRARHRCLRWR